jgi:hypothetical protein
MNQHIDDIPPFGDASHEREWLAQESAMRRERLHLDPAGDDARGRRYRLLARALREPPQDSLPADFAARVAARAAAAPASALRFEFVLMTALATVLAIAAGVVTAIPRDPAHTASAGRSLAAGVCRLPGHVLAAGAMAKGWTRLTADCYLQLQHRIQSAMQADQAGHLADRQ